MPFWLLLLAWPLLHERLRGLQWLAVAVAAGGLVFILEPWRHYGTLVSHLLAIAAGLSWAASSVVVKKLRRNTDVDLLSLTTWQMLLGALVLIVIAVLVPAPAGLASLAVPAVGVLAAWIELGERPRASEWLGMILIGTALMLLAVPGLRSKLRARTGRA
jgi:drug/metabolite transporter (DMT)-like permease